MADTTQLLGQIGKLIDQKLEPINKRLEQQGKAIENIQEGQAQIKTTLETLEAGQADIREQLTTKADKADILNLGVKLDKYQRQNEKRFDNVEEVAKTSNPNKN